METYNGTSGDGELKYNVDNQREAVMDRAIASSLPTEETPDPAVEEGTDALAKQPRDGPQDLCRRDLDADSGMEGTTEAETLDNAASNSGGKQESLKAPGTVTEGEVAFLSPSVANAQGILIANDSTQNMINSLNISDTAAYHQSLSDNDSRNKTGLLEEHQEASLSVSLAKERLGHSEYEAAGETLLSSAFDMGRQSDDVGSIRSASAVCNNTSSQVVPQAGHGLLGTSAQFPNDAHIFSSNQSDTPTRFLWVGNLTAQASRPILLNIFERFGSLEDLIAFPSRMYAFVTFHSVECAIKAVQSIQGVIIKDITGEKGMLIKYRPEKKVLSHIAEGIAKDGSSGRASSSGDFDVEPSPRIWLGNIAPTATAANLQAVLGRFGPLVDAAVFPARIGPLGYAFVKFERLEDAVNAYNTLNNAVVPALSGTKQVKMRYKPITEGLPTRDTALDAIQASIPSRHIWIGNVTQKPQEDILIQLFSRFGPIESARVFSAKSYAFVNFYDVSSAIQAMTKLDGVSVPVLTGLKPLVMRYQHETPSQQSTPLDTHVGLNSKVLELLSKSRIVPDSQLLSGSHVPFQGTLHQSHAPLPLQFDSRQAPLMRPVDPVAYGMPPNAAQTHSSTSHLTTVLQNLTALQGNLSSLSNHSMFVGDQPSQSATRKDVGTFSRVDLPSSFNSVETSWVSDANPPRSGWPLPNTQPGSSSHANSFGDHVSGPFAPGGLQWNG